MEIYLNTFIIKDLDIFCVKNKKTCVNNDMETVMDFIWSNVCPYKCSNLYKKVLSSCKKKIFKISK